MMLKLLDVTIILIIVMVNNTNILLILSTYSKAQARNTLMYLPNRYVIRA